jgi:dTMP kinase
MHGYLLVFEGVEGSGKTTQIARVAAALADRGVDHCVVREPGGTPVGERIRALLLDPAGEMGARAEALLFVASRAELVAEVIRPRLAQGTVVIADRFVLSTYAYQIAGRGLPEDEVRAANGLATGGIVPDLTVLLAHSARAGLDRAARRGGHDRIERTAEEFHERVAAAFVRFSSEDWQRAHPECGRIISVDAAGSEDDVFARVQAALHANGPQCFQVPRAGAGGAPASGSGHDAARVGSGTPQESRRR